MLEQNTKVKYLGADTSVLVKGKIYKVFSVVDGGIRVYIPRSFTGIKTELFEIVK